MRSVGSHWRRGSDGPGTLAASGRRQAPRGAGDLHAGDEPFEIALLLRVEVAGRRHRGVRHDRCGVGLAHSAGTRIASGATAAGRGLCVR
jgi:hypothetical protein